MSIRRSSGRTALRSQKSEDTRSLLAVHFHQFFSGRRAPLVTRSYWLAVLAAVYLSTRAVGESYRRRYEPTVAQHINTTLERPVRYVGEARRYVLSAAGADVTLQRRDIIPPSTLAICLQKRPSDCEEAKANRFPLNAFVGRLPLEGRASVYCLIHFLSALLLPLVRLGSRFAGSRWSMPSFSSKPLPRCGGMFLLGASRLAAECPDN